MGAVPYPLLITAGGRLMILEQLRFGVSSLYWCSFDLNRKKLEIPIIWVLLWLQGLQVLPVSGPTFGQSCGLQSTHCLILAETIRCIWSQRLRMMSANV
eukprot:s2176_g12.t5